MVFSIQDLINQKVFPGIKLLAGHKGAKNEIFWVNIMEILDSPKSVQAGELLFTTGYGLQQQEEHKDLIPQLSERGVSGLAIQTGYYIDKIPSYILEQADACSFPILLLPKNLTFSEILHTMTRIVAPDTQQDWQGNVLRQAHTFLEQGLAEHAELLSGPERCIQILLLEPVNYTNAEKANWSKCLGEVCSFIQSRSLICLNRELEQQKHIFLAAYASEAEFHSMLYRLNIKFVILSEQLGSSYYLGTGQLSAHDGVLPSLSRAIEALNTLQMVHARRGVCAYEHINFIKMLGQIHQKSSSVVLDNQPLQTLLFYDRVNGSGYVQTLRVYLANSCNMTQTARQLFLHRHTLAKRLEKISSIGRLDLEDYYTRIHMSIALLFHDYFVY